jgi:SAM-dependent methyltransferase
MLELARERAGPHAPALELVQADMRDLPDLGTFALVTVPFRALLHLRDDGERLAVLRALHERLRPGGTLAFDVFHPDRIDIDETQDRWMEREPGIDERAHWDEAERRLVLSVRADGVLAEMELWWADPGDWRTLLERAGFERIAAYGWFDRRPLEPGSTDSVWVARRPATG